MKIGYLIMLSLLFGCSKAEEMKDFKSDACSLFPDRSLVSEEDWCDCCFEHDITYWQGGTESQRLEADASLRDCILEKTKNTELAGMVYTGVRFGGRPYFYNWYRWGYGWNYRRKYQDLTVDEKRTVAKKLELYFDSNHAHPCESQ